MTRIKAACHQLYFLYIAYTYRATHTRHTLRKPSNDFRLLGNGDI